MIPRILDCHDVEVLRLPVLELPIHNLDVDSVWSKLHVARGLFGTMVRDTAYASVHERQLVGCLDGGDVSRRTAQMLGDGHRLHASGGPVVGLVDVVSLLVAADVLRTAAQQARLVPPRLAIRPDRRECPSVVCQRPSARPEHVL